MRRIHPTAPLLAIAGMLGASTLAFAAGTNAPAAAANSDSNAKQNQHATEAGADKSAQKPQASESGANKSGQSQQAPEGFVLVDEELITMTANEPQNHFIRAHEYLTQNDPRAAAAEVRIAASYLDMQATRKGDADQQELRTESHQLRQLADQIAKWPREQGSQQSQQPGAQNQANNSAQHEANNGAQHQANNGAQHQANNGAGHESDQVKSLGQDFSRAQRALAKHFQEEAKNEIGKQKAIRAGEDLDAAVSALSASFVWSGDQCSQECTRAVADARHLSEELLTPGGQGQSSTENGKSQPQVAQNNPTAEKNGKSQPQADKNSSNAEKDEEAQPAAARLSAESGNAASTSNRIPTDAEKVVDELGKEIDSVNSKTPQAQPSQDSKGKTEQHSKTDQNK